MRPGRRKERKERPDQARCQNSVALFGEIANARPEARREIHLQGQTDPTPKNGVRRPARPFGRRGIVRRFPHGHADAEASGRVHRRAHRSRKDWGRYVDLTTKLHRKVAAQADEFLAQLHARIEQAVRRTS